MPSHPQAGRRRGSRRGTSAPAGWAERAPGRPLRTPAGRVVAWGSPSVHEVKIIPGSDSAKSSLQPAQKPGGGGRDAGRLCLPRGCVRRGGRKAWEADASPPSAFYSTKKQLQPNTTALLLPDGRGNPGGELPPLRSPQPPAPPGWLCCRRHRTGAPTGRARPALCRRLPTAARPRLPLPPRPCPAAPIASCPARSGLPGHPPCRGASRSHSEWARSAPPLNALRAVWVGFDCRRQNGDIFPPFYSFLPTFFSPRALLWMMEDPEGRPWVRAPRGQPALFRRAPGPVRGQKPPKNLRDIFVSEQGSFFKGF